MHWHRSKRRLLVASSKGIKSQITKNKIVWLIYDGWFLSNALETFHFTTPSSTSFFIYLFTKHVLLRKQKPICEIKWGYKLNIFFFCCWKKKARIADCALLEPKKTALILDCIDSEAYVVTFYFILFIFVIHFFFIFFF